MHKRYEVIFNHNLQALMLTVDVKIAEGWAPTGGICVVMEKLDHNSLPDPNRLIRFPYRPIFWCASKISKRSINYESSKE